MATLSLPQSNAGEPPAPAISAAPNAEALGEDGTDATEIPDTEEPDEAETGDTASGDEGTADAESEDTEPRPKIHPKRPRPKASTEASAKPPTTPKAPPPPPPPEPTDGSMPLPDDTIF